MCMMRLRMVGLLLRCSDETPIDRIVELVAGNACHGGYIWAFRCWHAAGLDPMLNMLAQHTITYGSSEFGGALLEQRERQLNTRDHPLPPQKQTCLQFITQSMLLSIDAK